jgi:hypothetical protein
MIFSGSLIAGQSLKLTGGPALNMADPPTPQSQSWRIEFQMDSFQIPAAGNYGATIFNFAGTGGAAFLYPDGTLALETLRDQVADREPCFVSTGGKSNVLVRLQRDVTKMQITCELWSYDGTGYNTRTQVISKLGTVGYGGGVIGGGGINASIGFLRTFSTLVAIGGKPPVTGDKGDMLDLKFDGNTNDTSGKGHTITGAASYSATPNQVPISLPKTAGAPFWSTAVSLRAGFPAQLDGSASYSMADGSAALTYAWQQLSGPTNVIWQNGTTATPTLTGLIFGTYVFQLKVADSAGNTASTSLQVGAVATDSNGVVVNANPAADEIFGPMIAFGKNPWGYADERNLAMENLQANTFATPPTWSSPTESPTVHYHFPGVGPALTTTTSAIATDSLSIPVANPAALDLTSFPTEVLVGAAYQAEVVRICGSAGTTLQVCYDGRGFHAGHNRDKAATAWPAATGVWQYKVNGDGTHFFTTMCSNGAGFTVSASSYATSQGTVTLTPGSFAVTGAGTNWSIYQTNLAIAVTATHKGVPFTFLTNVASVSGAGGLTLLRAYPADADGGTYSYHIFGDQRNIVLHYNRTDGTDGMIYFWTSGCESDTALYIDQGWDDSYLGQVVTGSPYSYMEGFGYVGDFSPNFYDIGLAHYAFYFRSGLTQALNSARNLEDYWIRYPEIAQGDAGGIPRRMSILGTVAATVLDGNRGNNWPGLRSIAGRGVITATQNNCDDDLRETAYELSWLALAARYDPDPAQHQKWQGAMQQSWDRDNGCKGADNSYASAFNWAPSQYPGVKATKGSAEITPASGSFWPAMCFGVAHGTAVVSSGSATITALTGSFVPPAGYNNIIIGGTRNGVRYDLSTQFDFNSPNRLTLAALWPGDSGTVEWMIQNNDVTLSTLATIATGPADTENFGQVFGCTYEDTGHILLHRPWVGATGTYGFYEANLVGRGTQPFMAGIKALQMRYAGLAYPGYKSLDTGIANWVATTGFDEVEKALPYGRGFPECEPLLTDSGIKDVGYRNPSCMESAGNAGMIAQARARNAEGQNAMTVNYLANPTATNRALGDQFYGAIFGAPGYTATGYFSDGITASNLDNGNLGAYKWPGFFFGVGMAHQWPAARVGGVQPPKPRTVPVPVTISPTTIAQIFVTAPSGAIVSYTCTSSPCNITVDDRQGTHWYQIQYQSMSSGQVQPQTSGQAQSQPPTGPVLVPIPGHA